MTLEMHEDILLGPTLDGDGLPTQSYGVLTSGYEDIVSPAVASERSLTGALHVHRLLDGADPRAFTGARHALMLTRAEKDLLLADLGKDVYFMPHYRDDAAAASYRTVVLFESVDGLKCIDPLQDYWTATITLTESTGNTP